jgi:hypothetical protein
METPNKEEAMSLQARSAIRLPTSLRQLSQQPSQVLLVPLPIRNWAHYRSGNKKPPWPESESELYRPTGRRLSAKLVSTFADRGCHVVRVTDPYGRILGFIDRSRYFFQLAPQLYSRAWVDPVPDPLLLRKSGSTGNRTWTSGSATRNSWPLDHRGGLPFWEYMTSTR